MMKTTESFRTTIEAYLNEQATKDELFRPVLMNPKKNIEDCITYILNTVHKSGCNGFTDAEIFNMAIHYYDEPDVEVGNKMDMTVVVNHKVELTAEEIAEAKQKAIDDVISEQRKKMEQKPQKKVPAPIEQKSDEPLTLF